jgi:hypothetical protein
VFHSISLPDGIKKAVEEIHACKTNKFNCANLFTHIPLLEEEAIFPSASINHFCSGLLSHVTTLESKKKNIYQLSLFPFT